MIFRGGWGSIFVDVSVKGSAHERKTRGREQTPRCERPHAIKSDSLPLREP